MLAIQVLGVHGHKSTNSLMANTLKAINDLKLIAKVEEVSDIDHLIKYNISGVPAMVVNGELAFQKGVPEVADLKLLIQLLTKPAQKRKTMKNVLIPTDFSETAKNAFLYAQSFLSENTALTVFHAYHPQIDPVYPYIGTPSEGFFKQKEATVDKWSKRYFSLSEGEVLVNSVLDTELRIAPPTNAIVEKSKEMDLIVMGSTGETTMLEKAFGSTATYVARNAHCPVLMIPKDYQFKGYKKILYASNIEDFDEPMLQHLIDFTWDYDPEISLVHINKNNTENYEVVSEDYEQFFREKTPYLGVKFVKIESKNIIKGLQQYADENEIDLIVMATKHRGWVDEIFHKSMTKKMVLNTSVPLLVMHPQDPVL